MNTTHCNCSTRVKPNNSTNFNTHRWHAATPYAFADSGAARYSFSGAGSISLATTDSTLAMLPRDDTPLGGLNEAGSAAEPRQLALSPPLGQDASLWLSPSSSPGRLLSVSV